MENAVRNNIKNITVLQGDASLIGNEKYDFVFANIQRNVLLRDIPVSYTHLDVYKRQV